MPTFYSWEFAGRSRGGGAAASGGGSATAVYSNILGFGTASDFVPVLTKHASDRYIYVDPTVGNDVNDGTEPSRVATLGRAIQLWTTNQGDWIVVRMGSTLPNGFGTVRNKLGRSAQQPMVVTTFDPADPTNLSAMRQGYFTCCTTTGTSTPLDTNETARFMYFENMIVSLNAANGAIAGGDHLFQHIGPCDKYLMCFNCIFNPCQVTMQADGESETDVATQRLRFITFRACSFANINLAPPGGHSIGLYLNKTGTVGGTNDGVVVQDCIGYRCGWTTDRNSQADQFKHNFYFAVLTFNTVFERNTSGWASSHGLQMRGGGRVQRNVFSKNALALLIGGGNVYYTLQPTGVKYNVDYNSVSGGADITSAIADVRGSGITFVNTNADAANSADHNLVSNCGYTPADDSSFCALHPATDQGAAYASNPSHMRGVNNVVYNWGPRSVSGRIASDWHPSICFNDLTNSILPNDTPANGNVTAPGVAHPDPTRTFASWATGPGGFASESAAWDYLVAHPNELTSGQSWALVIGAYLQGGFTFTP